MGDEEVQFTASYEPYDDLLMKPGEVEMVNITDFDGGTLAMQKCRLERVDIEEPSLWARLWAWLRGAVPDIQCTYHFTSLPDDEKGNA